MKKDKKYTDQQKAFLEALFGPIAQGDIRAAMIQAGYSDNTPTSNIVDSLSEEIVELTNKYIAAKSAKAMMKMDNVLDSPNQPGAANIIKASKEFLDRAGLVRPDGDINIKIPENGIVILPAKGSLDVKVNNESRAEDTVTVEEQTEN